MSTRAISVDGVSKKFRLERNRPSSIKEAILRIGKTNDADDFWVLRDIQLQIERGSFFGLIGHNGSGKSTLLRLMAGIHRPTTGTIESDGRLSALLELGSGFHPDLTGRENVFLNGAMLGLSRKQMAESMDTIIEFSGIGDFIDEPVKIYSSGMYVRLGFAVAVNVDPEILLVDEVIAVGDEAFQRRCMAHMNLLREKGTTIVLVSHNTRLMTELCDTIGWLDHGRLMEVGPSEGVIASYLAAVDADGDNKLTTRD
ncbi:MAG: ABC transporter ATP-binding protein [Acidimicrobiales bacterium]|nr:ABC transporter ATP-binding protein [Acidimicrobiales bacterium]